MTDTEHMRMDLWLEERHPSGMAIRFRVLDKLFSGQSDFQKIDVVETEGHGKMLLNDGLIMVSERDEFVYHDMIAHVPLFVHAKPKNVLVIGGGDGGTAREVLRHQAVEQCDMVEIDPVVIEACRKHIPQTSCEFDNPRLNLMVEDGVKYVKQTDKKYDVILIDSTDPIGPAAPLFGSEFYTDVFNLLNDDGIVVSQGESPFYNPEVQQSMLKLLGQLFPVTSIYNFHNLTYPGGFWSFTFASKKYHPVNDLSAERLQSETFETQYYNPEVHRAAFALPNFMKTNLGSLLKS